MGVFGSQVSQTALSGPYFPLRLLLAQGQSRLIVFLPGGFLFALRHAHLVHQCCDIGKELLLVLMLTLLWLTLFILGLNCPVIVSSPLFTRDLLLCVSLAPILSTGTRISVWLLIGATLSPEWGV